MKIALDYDGTYDKAPELWDRFIEDALDLGHDVRIVTHRHHELDNIDDMIPEDIIIIYTDGVAKKWYCEHRHDLWTPDVWIDDRPKSILENGPLTQEQVEEWRNNR
jgi:hypothetical protein